MFLSPLHASVKRLRAYDERSTADNRATVKVLTQWKFEFVMCSV